MPLSPAPGISPPGLLGLISTAVAPVALITTTSILLSAYTAKYVNVSTQMRAMTVEMRDPKTLPERLGGVRRQLAVFDRRLQALWAASVFLYVALLFFLGTVFAVIFATRAARLNAVGAACVVAGLVCMVCAVLLELYDLRLARLTMAIELEDVLASGPPTASRKPPIAR